MRLNAQDASLLILICVVAFFLGYALLPDDYEVNFELKKISIQYSQSIPSSDIEQNNTEETSFAANTHDMSTAGTSESDIPEPDLIPTPTKTQSNKAAANRDISHTSQTTAHDITETDKPVAALGTDYSAGNFMPDKSRQRILFIGDSMLEGLSLRLNDYAATDDNYLMTVIWYASSSRHWGGTDSLAMLIRKYKPTYIFISCGGNELQTRNIEASRRNIRKIVNTFGDIPYIWIGPPNWKPDTGINDAIREIVGDDHFFDSSHMKLARKSDHIHPTYAAAAIWMDSIADWVSSPKVAHPIQMTHPTVKAQKRNLQVFKRAR